MCWVILDFIGYRNKAVKGIGKAVGLTRGRSHGKDSFLQYPRLRPRKPDPAGRNRTGAAWASAGLLRCGYV